jgi:hypothetical protein
MLWQADCFIIQMPWVRVREVGNMTHYPSGSLPAPGESANASFWLFPVHLSGRPRPGDLPARLNLQCVIKTGLFMQGPVVHRGEELPEIDWMPTQTWATTTAIYEIPNPESRAYLPPQDVSVTAVSASGLPASDIPPQSTRNAFARFTVRLVRGVPSLEVVCRATRSGRPAIERLAMFSNTGTSLSNAIDFGRLPAGRYDFACTADPNRRIPDGDPNNNSRSASATIYDPGVDLVLLSLESRDYSRFGFITPTTQREIGVWVEVENRSGEDAPDVVISCRRSRSDEPPPTEPRGRGVGTPPAEGSVRTGVIRSAERKTFTVRLPAPTQPGPDQMTCTVDATNVLREVDEANNSRTEAFIIEPSRTTDFAIELREFAAWTPTTPLSGHRTLRFQARNPTLRGPATPPPPGARQSLRWQADCFIMQMSWVRVRENGNMTHYPSGPLPGAGVAVNSDAWLFPVNLYGYPYARDLPAMLTLQCELTTGLFVQGPVVHRGEELPRTDWVPQQVWWRGTATLPIPNPESRARP